MIVWEYVQQHVRNPLIATPVRKGTDVSFFLGLPLRYVKRGRPCPQERSVAQFVPRILARPLRCGAAAGTDGHAYTADSGTHWRSLERQNGKATATTERHQLRGREATERPTEATEAGRG